jgi:light-regulated signal transduction histidine kinase (bacteriophytochrome)
VEIRARRTESGLVITVQDNGIGFDMQYHDHIFKVFQRLHRDDQYPGTGIGLALVRKAVERLGGKVWAESTTGKGAKFYVELPVRG